MPQTYNYPGVYVEEVPSGVRTIAGVSTSDTAFVDFFARGPVEDPQRITSFGDFERVFGGLDRRSAASYAIQQYFLNGGAVAWVVRATAGTTGTASVTLTDGTDDILQVDANSPGTWANRRLRVSLPSGADADAFNLRIEEVEGEGTDTVVVSTEEHFNLSMDVNAARYAPTIVNATSQMVELTRLSADTETTVPTTVVGTTDDRLEGGADGDEPGGTQWRTTTGAQALIDAMNTLDEIVPFVFNILCIPAAVDLEEADMNTVYANAISYVETKRAFLILDIPDTIASDTAMRDSWPPSGANYATRNAAAYFPRVLVPDALQGNTPRNMAASGTLAGIYARTDAQRGVWKAPGGTDAVMRGATVAVKINDQQNGALNVLGKNALRNFPIYSDVVWGARTMRGADQMADEYKYIPVRRTALYIEESLYQGLKWVVFEPNDEPLWAQIRLNVGAFMNSLFRQGAFQGTTAREAYFVKCDSETTTQNDIDRGIVNIVVGFAPLKPVEFVVLRIQQIAGQVQV